MKRNLRSERGRSSERWGTYRKRARMFMSAQEQMDKAIWNSDMVSVKAARGMLNAATKMLDAVKNHKIEQAKIQINIGTKQMQHFEKL